jgi:predicted phage-related endonuclease
MASLDGYCPESKRLIEIKCPNDKIFQEFTESGVIPEYYLWQIQHQLCVTELQECTLVLFNGEICSEVVIKRDEAMISKLVEKEYQFYQSMINFTPIDSPLVVREDEDMKEAVAAYEIAKAARIEAQELERICFDGIIYLANEKNCICNGKEIKKMYRTGSVDYKKIDELKNIDLNKYRRPPVEFWVIQ